jgi:hypothetical protein
MRISWALSTCSPELFIDRRHHRRAAGRVAVPVVCVEDDPIDAVVSPVMESAVSLPEVVGHHPRLRRLTFEKQQACKSNPSSKLHRSHRKARAWHKRRGKTVTATKAVSRAAARCPWVPTSHSSPAIRSTSFPRLSPAKSVATAFGSSARPSTICSRLRTEPFLIRGAISATKDS